MLKKINKQKGFTIIEALVALFIFSLITVTFYQTFTAGTQFILEVKKRNEATSLANQKMEIIRNMQYNAIGTIGGIPSGSLGSDEYAVSGNIHFHILTTINYVDDSLDGTGSHDTVNTTADYKIARVDVLWGKEAESNKVELVSQFVPPGVEQGAADEGTLVVNVSSIDDGLLSQAKVKIVDNDVLPNVNSIYYTDDNGQVSLPGAKIDNGTATYQITVSKDGYETVQTVDPNDPALTYSPIDKNGSVYAGGDPSVTDIIINKLANLKISSVDNTGAPIPDVQFSLVGGRVLDKYGTVFNLNESLPANLPTTGTAGEKIFSNISPGQYTLTQTGNISGYTFIKSEPSSPLTLNPGDSTEDKLIFANNDTNSLQVKITDSSSNPVAGATVKLKNATGYENDQTTLIDGMAFFANADNTLAKGDYELDVTAAGFQDATVAVSIDKFTKANDIKLTAQ